MSTRHPFRRRFPRRSTSWRTVTVRSDCRPAVLCLHILGGNGSITRAIASSYASRGLTALMPLMPMFLERTPARGRLTDIASPDGPRHLGETFRAVPHDIRRSLDVLAALPEVDPQRIGLIGTSLGGILGVGCIITGIFPGLALGPINTILGEYGAKTLDVGLSGVLSGPGTWNATGMFIMMAISFYAGRWFVKKYVHVREIDVYTCGVPMSQATSRMNPSSVFGALKDLTLSLVSREVR